MNQTARILLAAIVLAGTATTGCSRFEKADKSAPYVVRFQAVDVAGLTHPPVVRPADKDAWDRNEGANTGAPIVVTGLPINFAMFRVDLSKPIDPATVPNSVTLTVAPGDPAASFNVDDPLFAPVLGVDYDSSGLNPHFNFSVGYQTCGGVAPVITLEPLTTYTFSVNGVKDFAGQALPAFQFTVSADDFTANAVEVATAYHVDPDLLIAKGNAFADIVGGTPSAPVGFLENGAQTKATAIQNLTAYMQPWYSYTGIDKAYGAEVRLGFSSYMCYIGYEIFCQGGSPVWQDTTNAASPVDIDYQWLGDPQWPDATGALRQHLVSVIPLEDGRTYTVSTASGDWYDFNYADWGNNNGDTGIGGSFTTPAGTPRIVWQSFTSAAPAAGQGTVYPTLDSYLNNVWNGIPFIGFAANEPLTGGIVKLNEVLADGTRVEVDSKDLTLGGFAWAGDGWWRPFGDARNRTVAFQTAGTLDLRPDTAYEVAWTGLTVAGGTIGDGSFGFRTLPLARDPSYTGFYGSGWAMREYASSSGYVLGQMMPNSGNANTLYRNGPQIYGVRVPADLEFDAAAASLAEFDPVIDDILVQPQPAGRGSVKLYEGDEAGGLEVAGAGGILLPYGGGTAYQDQQYPGSFVGFLPSHPLENGKTYTLVAYVYEVGGATPTRIEMPFSTKPAAILSLRGTQLYPGYAGGPYDLGGGLALHTGSMDVVMANNTTLGLTVRVNAKVDPAQAHDYLTPNDNPAVGAVDPILMYRIAPSATQAGTVKTELIPITVSIGSSGFLNVRPYNPADIMPHTIYQVTVTSGLKTLAYDRTGAALAEGPKFAAYSVQFMTADQLPCTATDTRAACVNADGTMRTNKYPLQGLTKPAGCDPNDPNATQECLDWAALWDTACATQYSPTP